MTAPAGGWRNYAMELPPAFAPPVPDPGYPPDYMQPECLVGHTKPEFRHGCPACPYPGYQHPVLEWQARPCACPHHIEGNQP